MRSNRFDWLSIKASYERGLTPTEIANVLPDSPSRQAIEKRIKRDGWSVAERLPDSVAQIADPKTMVIFKARAGRDNKHAAQEAGISESTLYRWLSEDESFRSQLVIAKAARAGDSLDCIHQAIKRGDAQTAKWDLERNPLTRDQYGAQKSEGGLTIVLQIDRTAGITIEHEGNRLPLSATTCSDADARESTASGE